MEKTPLTTRRRAVALLQTVDDSDRTIASLLRSHIGLPGPDQALLAELVYGAVRWRSYLRWVLSQKATKPLRKLPPELLLTLEVALYQLLFLEKIPAYAIIWEAVEAVKGRFGPMMARLANGILRSVERESDKWRWRPLVVVPAPDLADVALSIDSSPWDKGRLGGVTPIEKYQNSANVSLKVTPPNPLLSQEGGLKYALSEQLNEIAVHYAFPPWLVERWCARFGVEECVTLLDFLNRRPDQTVRVNEAKMPIDALMTQLSAEGFEPRRHPLLSAVLILKDRKLDRTHPAYTEGRISFQSLSSQVVVEIASALLAPGESLLDGCAGAGGKVLGIAEKRGADCRYQAWDVKQGALADLEKEKNRLDVPNIEVLNAPPQGEDRHWNVVLVDAPCSGLGTIQKNPELKWRRSAETLPQFGGRQHEVLTQYAPHVAPGGRLLYSVCSTEPEENDAVIARFLHTHPDFKVASLNDHSALQQYGTPTEYGWALYPHRIESEGFFIAVLQCHACQ